MKDVVIRAGIEALLCIDYSIMVITMEPHSKNEEGEEKLKIKSFAETQKGYSTRGRQTEETIALKSQKKKKKNEVEDRRV